MKLVSAIIKWKELISSQPSRSLVISEYGYYIKILELPLELGMFIPCDLEGNVLEEPLYYKNFINSFDKAKNMNPENLHKCEKYQEAKERVLFKGFELRYYDRLDPWIELYNGKVRIDFRSDGGGVVLKPYKGGKLTTPGTIEDLTELGLELTDSAIKQLR